MPYTLEELVRQFKNAGRTRKGSQKYANDASYWDGGRCNWGGLHSLQEDCQTLMNSFNKIESLRDIKKELEKCTSKNEYDAKKSNYIRKCEESLRGLKEKSTSSSIFGVCCIWSDEGMDKHVISKLKSFTDDLSKLKENLEREDYKWVEEINQLNLEIRKVETEIEKLRKEVIDEKDPIRRGKILEQIEEQGKILEGKYRKRQELSKKFNFDPKRKIDSLIESIKKAIERKNKTPRGTGGGGGSKRNPNPTNSDNETESDSDSSDDDDNSNKPNQKKDQPNFFQSNQQLILIAGVAVLIIFFFYTSQKPSKPTYNYDF